MFIFHELELDWIVALQGDGALNYLMSQASCLGAEALPYALPFVYFCLSRRAGAQLYLLFSFSGCRRHILKLAFHLPRP